MWFIGITPSPDFCYQEAVNRILFLVPAIGMDMLGENLDGYGQLRAGISVYVDVQCMAAVQLFDHTAFKSLVFNILCRGIDSF